MSVYAIVKQLEATASRLDKEAILTANKDNEDLKNFFRLALENRINFYIKKIPAYVPNGGTGSFNLAMSMVEVTLAGRVKTGNDARAFLSDLLSDLTMEDGLMLERVIRKDPKCGCSVSTVNKSWPGLVTDVPYMQCSLPKEVDMDAFPWEKGVYSQLKADGMFANLSQIDSQTVTLESRNGSPFPIDQFEEIYDAVIRSGIVGFQLHGELIIEKDGEVLPRQISNGILNSILNGDSIPENHRVIYEAWDIIPLEEAKAKNKYRVVYEQRFNRLKQTISALGASWPIRLIESRLVFSYEEAYQHYKEKRKQRLEGTIVKRPDMIWEDSTSKGQVKMKEEVECDLRIIGFNAAAETSKNADTFGSVLLETSDSLLEVSATGIPDDLRKEINEIKDQLIGTIVTVCSNTLMEPSKNNKKHSLFLPRVVEFRRDKTEADSLRKVIDMFDSAIE